MISLNELKKEIQDMYNCDPELNDETMIRLWNKINDSTKQNHTFLFKRLKAIIDYYEIEAEDWFEGMENHEFDHMLESLHSIEGQLEHLGHHGGNC